MRAGMMMMNVSIGTSRAGDIASVTTRPRHGAFNEISRNFPIFGEGSEGTFLSFKTPLHATRFVH